MDDATRALAELQRLLEPSDVQRGQPVDIYLVDHPADIEGSDTPSARAVLAAAVHGQVIVQALGPGTLSGALASQLTQLLVARWFGPASASAEPVVAGLLGLVRARIGAGPAVEDADRQVLVASPNANPEAAAMSFVAFLIRMYGDAALREYLAVYDPARREYAAIAVYSRPLAALEEDWLADLQRRTSTGAAGVKLARWIIPRIRTSWLREIEVAGYTLLDTGLAVAFPLVTGQFVNEIVAGSEGAILPYAALLGGIFLLMTPVAMRRAYSSALLSQNIALGLQHDVFTRLLRLPHGFHSQANVGDLMARLGTDTERVRGAIETVLRGVVFTVVKGLAAAVVLFFIEPVLALLALVTVPFFWIGYLVLRSRLEAASSQAQTLFGDVSSAAHEGLSAHAVVKAFGLEHRVESEYRDRLRAFFGAIRRLVTLGSALDASTSAAMTLSQLVVLVVGGYMVSQGQMEVGFLFTFLATVPMLFEGGTALAGLGKTIEEASGSMERVLEILEAPLEVEDRPGAAELRSVTDEICFEGVTFGYDGRPVLDGLNLSIPAGSTIAVVGESGCGKTTVANLLLRFWDPHEGGVAIDGHDIRDVTLASLRAQVGIVFQETFVFDTTVRENIAFARPDATDAEVEAAARIAQLEGYVAGLPNGYDTVVGERGVRMSGGQRQRLAIARALLRDPAILILDEATSALDAETEAEIQRTLREISVGRTTITITHRMTSASTADRIVVLDSGRIVEDGTHGELIAAGGLYRRLHARQLSGAVDGARKTQPAGRASE